MSKVIRVAGVDPSLAAFGMAKVDLDLRSMKMSVVDLKLIETSNERGKKKTVRQNSDDLRRGKMIVKEFHAFVGDCRMVFGEIPSGGQSARAVLSFGMSIGILAGCPKPLFQIQPSETKLATVGTKTASKEEMIEWAVEAYPNAPWFRLRDKPGGKIIAKNEHIADALAVVHAGLETDQFAQFMTMYRSAA